MANDIICEISSAGEIVVEINGMTYQSVAAELALKADKTSVDNQDATLTAQLAEAANRIDNLVATPVPVGEIIAEEIIDARDGETSVGVKIRKLDNNLELINKKTRIVNSNPNNYEGAIVTFIDDDGSQYIPDIWLPIIQEKGIKMGFAVITGFISGQEPYEPTYTPMSIQQLRDLYSNGHDVYSHSHTHPAFYENDVSIQEIENQCALSQEWLKNNGFERNADIIVYSGGLGQSNLTKKNAIRKYYRYGIDTTAQVNPDIVDNWCIYRVNTDTLSLAELKTKVDEALANGRWLVFMSHAYEMNLDKVNQVSKIRYLIDYIRSVNIPIMPFSEAEKLKGNSVAIGEYTTSPKMFINHKGDSLGVPQATSGTWQPTLVGSIDAGTHIYTSREGTWEKIGRMVFLTFNIRIEWNNLDALMRGELWVTGLPFVSASLVRAPVEYNHLTLEPNYSEVIISVTPAENKILFFRQGNAVGTAFVDTSHLTPNHAVILRGQINYFTVQ